MEALTEHCLAAREIIGEQGSPVMMRLIDLLLFEVGALTATEHPARSRPREVLEDA